MIKAKNYVLYVLRPVSRTIYDVNKKNYFGRYAWVSEDRWVPTYMNKGELIHYLAVNYSRVIKNMSLDMTEEERKFNFESRDREYMYYVVKVNNKSEVRINIGDFYTEIIKEQKRLEAKKAKRAKKWAYRRKCEMYTFREGPVPNIRCYRCGGGWYRHPQLQQVRKLNSDVEYDDFNETKYRAVNLPSWDDRPRHKDKSWKTSCKVRKQWMKHQKEHIDRAESIESLINLE